MKPHIQIHDLVVLPSTKRNSWQRAVVQVDYGTVFGGADEVWLEFPSNLSPETNLSGDPWLLFFLPLAFTLQQPLLVDLAVDPVLLENVQHLMKIWNRWRPNLNPIEIEVAEVSREPKTKKGRKAVFFSAGVDSFHSLLDHEDGQDPIDDLLFIHGFDIDVNNGSAYRRVLGLVEAVASHYNKSLVPLTTNLRQTRFQEADWSGLSHGCMLAGCAQLLSPRYQRVVISSTLPSFQIRPFGSHIDTDHLFSSSQIHFEHFGGPLTRYEKMESIIRDPFALDHLRVCFEDDQGGNCGRCLKCVIVMTMLECHGALEHSRAFEGKPLNLDLIRSTYISEGFNSFDNIKEFAGSKGRRDIIEAVDDAYARTKRLDKLGLGVLRRSRETFSRSPNIRRFTRFLRPSLWRFGRWLNRIAS